MKTIKVVLVTGYVVIMTVSFKEPEKVDLDTPAQIESQTPDRSVIKVYGEMKRQYQYNQTTTCMLACNAD